MILCRPTILCHPYCRMSRYQPTHVTGATPADNAAPGITESRSSRRSEQRHHHLAEAAAFLEVRISRQNECADPERLIGAQLRRDLLRIADDRNANAAAREPDARPQILFDDERRRCRRAPTGAAVLRCRPWPSSR